MAFVKKLIFKVWDLAETSSIHSRKVQPLWAKICKNPFTFSVFQKLWPFVSEHVRAFPTFQAISKSTNPSRFYYNYSLFASKRAFISNFSHFPSLHVVEFNSRVSKWGGFAFETWARLIEFLQGSEQSSTPWPYFRLKYPIETSFQSWTSARIR